MDPTQSIVLLKYNEKSTLNNLRNAQRHHVHLDLNNVHKETIRAILKAHEKSHARKLTAEKIS